MENTKQINMTDVNYDLSDVSHDHVLKVQRNKTPSPPDINSARRHLQLHRPTSTPTSTSLSANVLSPVTHVRSFYLETGCPPCHLMILQVFPTFFITASCLSATTVLRKTAAAMLENRT